MKEGGKMKSLGGLNGLLCSSTLRSTLGSQHGPGLNAREGLKDLLLRPQNLQESPHSKTPLAQDSSAVFKTDPNLHRWERCLALLVEDFISRKGDLLRLNKARREQIEAYLRSYSGNEISLEKATQGRLGSPEQEALQLFASQCAAFHRGSWRRRAIARHRARWYQK